MIARVFGAMCGDLRAQNAFLNISPYNSSQSSQWQSSCAASIVTLMLTNKQKHSSEKLCNRAKVTEPWQPERKALGNGYKAVFTDGFSYFLIQYLKYLQIFSFVGILSNVKELMHTP